MIVASPLCIGLWVMFMDPTKHTFETHAFTHFSACVHKSEADRFEYVGFVVFEVWSQSVENSTTVEGSSVLTHNPMSMSAYIYFHMDRRSHYRYIYIYIITDDVCGSKDMRHYRAAARLISWTWVEWNVIAEWRFFFVWNNWCRSYHFFLQWWTFLISIKWAHSWS